MDVVQNLYERGHKSLHKMELTESGLLENPNTIVAQISKLYNNEEYSDIEFAVIEIEGLVEKKFFAHKLILSIASPLFSSMFYGPRPFLGETFYLRDITIKTFSNVLTYIYADKIEFRNVYILFETLFASRKFKLNSLKEKCLRILHAIEIPPEGACEIYELAIQHEVWDVASTCHRIFEFETREVLKSNGFLSARVTTVATILKKDYLEVESESELFDAVVKWGEFECRRKKIENITSVDIRKCVNCFLPFIRFLTLAPLETVRLIERHKIFTSREGSFILLKLKQREVNFPGVSDKFSKSEDKRISPYCKFLFSTTNSGMKYHSQPPLVSNIILNVGLRIAKSKIKFFGIGINMGEEQNCDKVQRTDGSLNFSVKLKNGLSTEVVFTKERLIADNKCELKFHPSLEVSENRTLCFEIRMDPNVITKLVNAQSNFLRYQKLKTNVGDVEVNVKYFFCPIVSGIELLFENKDIS